MSDENLLKHLSEIVGSENFFSSTADRLNCAQGPAFVQRRTPEILPLACARPRSMGQLGKLVKFCAQEGLPIAIRGGCTALDPPSMDARPLVILTTGLNRILALDAENRLAIVECGVSCAGLAQAAGRKNLFYPPDPGSQGISTIGGNLSMNAAGPRSLKYGPSASYALELGILTASGETFHVSAQNGSPGKLVPGFPLSGLLCGSAGTLAIICQATLRLLPEPKARRILAWPFSDCLAAAAAPAAILAAGITPCSMEFADETCAHVLGLAGPLLFLELDGHPAQVEEDMVKCREILSSLASGAEAGQSEAADFRTKMPGLAPALFSSMGSFQLESICLPPSRLPAFMEALAQMGKRMRLAAFGHSGMARMHVACFAAENSHELEEIRRELFTLELVLNNAMQTEEDASLARGQWQNKQQGIRCISEKLRAVLDPGGLFSPMPLPGGFLN